jgi:hypothetical protein
MGGGLFQLVIYGIEDLVLTHNPEVTFFKSVYKRYTNFTREAIPHKFLGEVDFGRRCSLVISRNGDLINECYLELTLPKIHYDSNYIDPLLYNRLNTHDNNINIYSWVKYIGYKIIKTIDIEIGSQIIDKHYSDWLYIWSELTCPVEKKKGLDRMVGNIPKNYDFNEHIGVDIEPYTCYIPLQFWFCKSPNLALPIIALKNNEVKINVEFEQLENCLLKAKLDFGRYNLKTTMYQTSSNILGVDYLTNRLPLKALLYIDFIFLDKKEREMFVNKNHEYCIEQLQFITENKFFGDMSSVPLNFNHPIKELIWCFQYEKNILLKNFFNYTNSTVIKSLIIDDIVTLNDINDSYNILNSNEPITNNQSLVYSKYKFEDIQNTIDNIEHNGINPVNTVKLILNGNDRISEQTGGYTNYIQQYNHHSNISINGINCYNFALYPENIQPSGTFNFSMLDETTLENSLNSYYFNDLSGLNNILNIETGNGTIIIAAINYNILKITNGFGGILFSN